VGGWSAEARALEPGQILYHSSRPCGVAMAVVLAQQYGRSLKWAPAFSSGRREQIGAAQASLVDEKFGISHISIVNGRFLCSGRWAALRTFHWAAALYPGHGWEHDRPICVDRRNGFAHNFRVFPKGVKAAIDGADAAWKGGRLVHRKRARGLSRPAAGRVYAGCGGFRRPSIPATEARTSRRWAIPR